MALHCTGSFEYVPFKTPERATTFTQLETLASLVLASQQNSTCLQVESTAPNRRVPSKNRRREGQSRQSGRGSGEGSGPTWRTTLNPQNADTTNGTATGLPPQTPLAGHHPLA